MGYPHGLIRYTTQNAIDGKPTRVLRPRVFVYGLLLLALCAGWAWGVGHRSPLIAEVLRDRNALYRETGDGRIENGYTLKLVNKDVEAAALPPDASMRPQASRWSAASGSIDAPAEQVLNLPLTLSAPAGVRGKHAVTFQVERVDGTRPRRRGLHFLRTDVMDAAATPLREPMMWLVIGLPLAVGRRRRRADRDRGAQRQRRRGDRPGAAHRADPGQPNWARTQRASALKLSAVLRVDDGHGRTAAGRRRLRDGATRDAADAGAVAPQPGGAATAPCTLAPSELGWRATIELLAGPRLAAAARRRPTGSWRLRGRLPAGQQAAHLRAGAATPDSR